MNLRICKAMLGLTRSRRTRQVERLFKAIVGAASAEVVLLNNLEVLVDRGLEVEPLRLLPDASRNRTLVAAWDGTFRDGTLVYAEPGLISDDSYWNRLQANAALRSIPEIREVIRLRRPDPCPGMGRPDEGRDPVRRR